MVQPAAELPAIAVPAEIAAEEIISHPKGNRRFHTANTAAPTVTMSAANATASASDCPLRNPPTEPVAISATTDHNSTIPRGASAVAESTSASAESRITGAGRSDERRVGKEC